MNRPSFGRRAQCKQGPAKAVTASDPAIVPTEPAFSLDIDTGPDLDGELRAWKAQRSFQIPWRQISLMASICFGIASFVLPDSVSNVVNWILYGLSAMSLYVWYTGRKKKA